MSNPQTPPQIFDRALLACRRNRALARTPLSFLMKRCAEDAAERIMDINRQFDRALIIAPPAATAHMLAQIAPDRRPKRVTTGYFTTDASGLDAYVNEEKLGYEGQTFDLIISLLGLQSVNDLPGALVQLRSRLEADGVLIASVFAGETGQALRQFFYRLDEAVIGGMTPRLFPMADHLQLAGLLQRTGFALPVVDTDRFNINYRSIDRLISDLRDLGETNVLTARHGSYAGKKYYRKMQAEFTDQFAENGMDLGVEIMWLTGWSPHDSQQKPLKPGSAQISLKDVLGKNPTD